MHNLFDLEDDESTIFSKIQCVPVPWDLTCSSSKGTRKGPRAILEASDQVDLYEMGFDEPYSPGMFMRPEKRMLRFWNRAGALFPNLAFKKMNEHVYGTTKYILARDQIPVIVGGDHSVPLGAYEAMSETQPFSIVQIDAHMDLRKAYQGFQFSHASIMRNVIDYIPNVTMISQIGVRDFCEEEYDFMMASDRVQALFYEDIRNKPFVLQGAAICKNLHKNVWLSVDIDGLDPKLCPNTGTPVPGGLEFYDVTDIAKTLVREGKKIVGFDLVEVSPKKGSIDANIGARLLYKLSCITLASQGLVTVKRI